MAAWPPMLLRGSSGRHTKPAYPLYPQTHTRAHHHHTCTSQAPSHPRSPTHAPLRRSHSSSTSSCTRLAVCSISTISASRRCFSLMSLRGGGCGETGQPCQRAAAARGSAAAAPAALGSHSTSCKKHPAGALPARHATTHVHTSPNPPTQPHTRHWLHPPLHPPPPRT